METAARLAPATPRPRLRGAVAEPFALIRPAPFVSPDSMPPTVPHGDGHTVLVIPALLRGDPYTDMTRRFLTSTGYSARCWELGMNLGPTKRLLNGALQRLSRLSEVHGPVSIVGFSMGGLFARWLSHRLPDRVRQVITVCGPIQSPAANFWFPVEHFPGLWRGVDVGALAEEIARPLPVPGTFLFSRDDGLVNAGACRDPNAPNDDNIEISGPHVLMARNPEVLAIIARRLARSLAVTGIVR